MSTRDDVRWWFTWWRFKRRRRKMEYWAFLYNDPAWRRVRAENNVLGVWGAAYCDNYFDRGF